MKNRYIHSEDAHNLTAPSEIVPEIIKLLNPKSVIDIGCGIGTFLYCFKNAGVKTVLGIDGAWTNKELLYKYLEKEEFQESDLEVELTIDRKFDIALSLEVAEHISPLAADVFVKNLITAGNVVVFSAAIPFQGGQNHVNEQWLTYWEEKFSKHGYLLYDIFRPLFWDNPHIFWWYKQNMVLFAPPGLTFWSQPKYNNLKNVVHYDLFDLVAKKLNSTIHGKLSPMSHFKLFVKSILYK